MGGGATQQSFMCYTGRLQPPCITAGLPEVPPLTLLFTILISTFIAKTGSLLVLFVHRLVN